MTWKPTEEMVAKGYASFAKGGFAQPEERMTDALIAVQPLIAEEERERYKNECAKFGYSCAHVSALLEEKRVMWVSDVETLVVKREAEARAKALQEVIAWCGENNLPDVAMAVRFLIPKPVEGA